MAHKKSVAFDNVLCKEDVFGDCDHVGFFLSRCWICYTYEDDEDAPDDELVNPCGCKGSTKWVHQM